MSGRQSLILHHSLGVRLLRPRRPSTQSRATKTSPWSVSPVFTNIDAHNCFSVLTRSTSFIFLAWGNQKIKCIPLVKGKQIYHNCLHLNLRPQHSYPGILFRSKKQHYPANYNSFDEEQVEVNLCWWWPKVCIRDWESCCNSTFRLLWC